LNKKLSNAKFNTYFNYTTVSGVNKEASKLTNSLEELSSLNDQGSSDGPGERENKPSFSYKTLIVNDPINNRDKILSFAKGQLGVYIWTHSTSLDILYVGHSVSSRYKR
jgi:hypothetical protein